MTAWRWLGSLGVAIAAATVWTTAQTAPAYDVVVRHGTVIDGSGLPRYQADVAIVDGSIARVGNLSDAKAPLDIDATGLFVTPGFINIHSHATPDGLRHAENMLTQGVTTEILNADGAGPIDIGAQLHELEAAGLAVNVGANIGFNSVWANVVGLGDRRATPEEITRMRALITTGLQQGAWGVSAGLDYKPGYYAQAEEVIQVVGAAKPWRTIFTNHDRITPESGFSSRVGMEETLAIGDRAGLVPVITHMKVQGHEQGSSDRILGEMRTASAEGRYSAADVYPYLAGQTGLVALIVPGWAQDGGRPAMLQRFADPVQRARIVKEAEEAMNARFGGAAGVYLTDTRRELTAVMDEMHVSAGEAVVRLLERSSPGIIARFGAESDLVQILKYPASSVACDCGSVVHDASHPRYYGTFPRVLGRYVREQHVLTWEDAIRKMSGLPAATTGFVDRGLIAVGMAADITVFDPATVIDHATFEEPMKPSDGITFVLVNGKVAVSNGRPIGAQGGRALARSDHMPARAMSDDVKRSLVRSVTVDGAQVTIDVMQAAAATHASGTFRVRDGRTNISLDMKDFGVLQTSGEWATFTGRAALRPSEPERAITVMADGNAVIVSAGDYRLGGR